MDSNQQPQPIQTDAAIQQIIQKPQVQQAIIQQRPVDHIPPLRNRFKLILLMVFLLVVAIYGGLYFYLQNQAPKVTKTTEANPAAATRNKTDIQKSSDTSMCDNLDHLAKSDCYRAIAKEQIDFSICDKIQDKVEKGKCYVDLVAEGRKDLSMCDKIQDPGEKDICYGVVAEQKKELSICGRIKNQDIKDMCYGNIINGTKDPLTCGEIQDQLEKNICYDSAALALQDPSVCDRIQEQSVVPAIRYYCYEKVAVKMQDPSVCKRSQRQSTIDNCYVAVAFAVKDSSICNKIQDQETKNFCYKNIVLEK